MTNKADRLKNGKMAKKYCNNVQIVETENELNIEILEGTDKIGIMAGASTPKESIENVVEKLRKIWYNKKE